jgi:hypothetical protein
MNKPGGPPDPPPPAGRLLHMLQQQILKWHWQVMSRLSNSLVSHYSSAAATTLHGGTILLRQVSQNQRGESSSFSALPCECTKHCKLMRWWNHNNPSC